jgi:stage II sporulation protein D
VRLPDQTIAAFDLEEYVRASILTELSPADDGDPGARARVFEVQSILARSFALAGRGRHAGEGYDLCSTTHCQLVDPERVARSRWRDVAEAAVRATEGRVIWHEGAPAVALFHADCGGARSAAADVWGGGAGAYLAGGPDALPGGAEHRTWRFAIGRDELREALARDRRTNPGARLGRIDVYARDAAGRAALVIIAGERTPIVRGEEFRAVAVRTFGARSLLSTWFDVRIDGDRFEFEGRGFGHGVGLCQRGAAARAEAGATAEEILQFYFPGTSLADLRITRAEGQRTLSSSEPADWFMVFTPAGPLYPL